MLWSAEMAVIKKKLLPLAALSSGIMLHRAAERGKARQGEHRIVVVSYVVARFACRSLRSLTHPKNLGWFFR